MDEPARAGEERPPDAHAEATQGGHRHEAVEGAADRERGGARRRRLGEDRLQPAGPPGDFVEPGRVGGGGRERRLAPQIIRRAEKVEAEEFHDGADREGVRGNLAELLAELAVRLVGLRLLGHDQESRLPVLDLDAHVGRLRTGARADDPHLEAAIPEDVRDVDVQAAPGALLREGGAAERAPEVAGKGRARNPLDAPPGPREEQREPDAAGQPPARPRGHGGPSVTWAAPSTTRITAGTARIPSRRAPAVPAIPTRHPGQAWRNASISVRPSDGST